MLDAWHNFKICGPIKDDETGRTWVLFGQRHDGAVFWRILFVAPGQDFWGTIALVFEYFDFLHGHQAAPEESYVPFKDVGVWFRSEDGDWFLK